MKRNNVALELVKEEEVMETEVEVVETAPVKKKWSVKKKLAVAGAAVLGLVIGAIALSHKNKNVEEADSKDEAIDMEEVVGEEEETETEESTESTQTEF
jgi:hypothetical protein